jgi:hypothetical protein
MAPAELLERVRARPFKPFRIIMSDGMVYEVHHPEMVIVARSTAHIGYPAPSPPGAVARVDTIDLRDIDHVEFLPEPASTG